MNTILNKYASLLVNYCVELQEGENLYVRTTTLAEPLVREIYREALKVGGHVEVEMRFREQERIFLQEAQEEQLKRIPQFFKQAIENFDAYIFVRAPFNLRENQGADGEKVKIIQAANEPVNKTYFSRTATRDLKRNLCQYPTIAAAQNAGLSLEEYERFVFNACNLFEEDPKTKWLEVRAYQQQIVDVLNQKEKIHYKGDGIDLTFRTKGRTWINSDGQTNMPSGEVYTSPIEDSVNGVVHFSFPGVYMGREVEGVTFWVENGYIEKWEATRGKDFLDYIFTLPGTRYFLERQLLELTIIFNNSPKISSLMRKLEVLFI